MRMVRELCSRVRNLKAQSAGGRRSRVILCDLQSDRGLSTAAPLQEKRGRLESRSREGSGWCTLHRALEDRADLDCRSMAIWTAIGEVKGWERRRVDDVQTFVPAPSGDTWWAPPPWQ
jgi:hypothetical protein